MAILEFLLNNWAWIAAFAVTGFIAYLLAFQAGGGWQTIAMAAVAAALFFGAHELDIYRLEQKEAADITAQQTADTKSCNADKAITEGVSHAYEDKITALNSQLNDLQRVRPNVCVTIAAVPTRGSHGSAQQSKPAGSDAGVNSDALYALAGEGEKYRLQLIACQQFVTETWAEKAAQ
jgi:hypothetical protein